MNEAHAFPLQALLARWLTRTKDEHITLGTVTNGTNDLIGR
jgi:hypothetical protein